MPGNFTYMAMGFWPHSFPVGGMYVKGNGRLTKVLKKSLASLYHYFLTRWVPYDAGMYPSSKWSSQWPYDGYIRHGRTTSCGRGRDSATPECFGRGSRGTNFVRSSKLSLFFPELCPFRRVFFCFPRFWKIWCQTFKLWGFWFRQCLWGLFENSAPSPGIFCKLRLPPWVFFWKFPFFFPSSAGVLLAWELWRSPG